MKKYFYLLFLGTLLSSGPSYGMNSNDLSQDQRLSQVSGAKAYRIAEEQLPISSSPTLQSSAAVEANLVKATGQESVASQGLEIENSYRGINVAFRMSGLSPYPEDRIIHEDLPFGSTKVSILQFLQEGRERVNRYPEYDHGFWFVVYTPKNEWRTSIHLDKRERNDVSLCLGNKKDAELADLENNFILKISYNGSSRFERKIKK